MKWLNAWLGVPEPLPPLTGKAKEWFERAEAGESIYSIARSAGMKPSQLLKESPRGLHKWEDRDLLDAIFDLQNRVCKLEGKKHGNA